MPTQQHTGSITSLEEIHARLPLRHWIEGNVNQDTPSRKLLVQCVNTSSGSTNYQITTKERRRTFSITILIFLQGCQSYVFVVGETNLFVVHCFAVYVSIHMWRYISRLVLNRCHARHHLGYPMTFCVRIGEPSSLSLYRGLENHVKGSMNPPTLCLKFLHAIRTTRS